MIRMSHVIAIGALIASATYAYSIKYETLYHGEELAKLKLHLQKEREAIAVLKAEWQHLNRPDRLQMLAERHLNLQPLSANQLVRFSDVPARAPKVDGIGQKLEALGLNADEAPTASIPRPAAAAPPRPPQRTP
jgi:cell division protein FtsL